MRRRTSSWAVTAVSKNANPGELRTPVYFYRIERTKSENYVDTEKEVSVLKDKLGKPVYARCKWVNAHGSEVWSDQAQVLRSPATLTLRYNKKLLDPTLIIRRAGDDTPYEVVNIDNVQQRNRWLEITVQRKVNAR